jgi:broad specificity phosphatase PhoE
MDSASMRDKLLGWDLSKRCRLYLVRHGQAANVTNGVFRYNGHIDVGVSPEGICQIEGVAQYLREKPIASVYCSDLKRSRTGAEAIARYHGLAPEAYPEFREGKMGIWEGLTLKEIKERYPKEVDEKFSDFINYRVPGGENLLDIQKRALPKLRELVALNRGGEIVLVGHGGMNMVLLCEALGLGFDRFFRITQANGCLNIIDYFHGTSVVRLMNGFVEEGAAPV